jgi:hypothetical protein
VRTTLDADLNNHVTENDHRQTQKYNAKVDYDKLLHGGRINAHFVNRLVINSQDGTPNYVEEQPIGTSTFDLKQTNINFDTLKVESCYVDKKTRDKDNAYSCDCYKNKQCSFTVDSQLWTSLSEGSDWDHNKQQVNVINAALTSGSYEFRATYSLVEGTYTTLSNTSSYVATLHLFDDVFSSRVSHSSTRERFLKGDEGYDSNIPLLVKRNGLDLTLNRVPITANVSYNWLDSDKFNEKRLLMSAGYASGHRINKNLNLHWGTGYNRESSSGKDSTGENRSGTKKLFNMNFSISGLIPRSKLRYVASTGYSVKRGFIPTYQVDENGLWQEINYHDDDTNNYSNIVGINGLIPYVGFMFTLNGKYQLTNNLTNHLDTTTKQYALSTHRDWIFGSTTLSLSAKYSILDQRGEVGTQYGTDTHNMDNNAEITFVMKRELF